jgi:hypothetical protein
VTVLIGADICPIEGNSSYFQAGDAPALFNDLLPDLQSADVVMANLEGPLVDRPTPIQKTGPTFGEPSACINGIKAGGIDVLTLANNHIMDHGPEGLANTLDVCAKAAIQCVGAGKNLAEARKILVVSAGGLRLGILAVAEREFSIAGKSTPGANPIDIPDFVRNVAENRGRFDYLIVLLHGADEFHVPTPRIQDTCRFMIEMGAGAVIVQHPHCLGGAEQYRGGHIVYGQGAFVMDEGIYRSSKGFHEGFLVKLTIGADFRAQMELIPFAQSDPVPGARRISADRERIFRKEFTRMSEHVSDPSNVERDWLGFCEKNKHGYISALLGHGKIMRRLNADGLFSKLIYTRRVRLTSRNIVSCETHREAIDTIFRANLI